MYLKPALAGASSGHRMIANYRNQWPNIAQEGYVTYASLYDYNLADLNSGIGILATVDQAGSANLSSTAITFMYSYKLRLVNKWILTLAVSFGYANRSIDFDKLIFGDQLDFTLDGQVPTSD